MKKFRLVGVGNIGYLQRALMIDVNDVIDIYSPDRYISSNDAFGMELPVSALKLAAGVEPVEVYFVPGTGNYEEFNAPGSDVFDQRVLFSAPGDWKEFASFINFCRGKKWLILMEDTNGMARLAGDKKQGLSFSHNFSSSSREYALSFEGVVPHAAYYLQGLKEEDFLGSTSGFTSGFSFGYRS